MTSLLFLLFIFVKKKNSQVQILNNESRYSLHSGTIYAVHIATIEFYYRQKIIFAVSLFYQ